MGMANPIRLTKPRISAMILEGTATFVSLVLVLWLLLWFIWRTPVTNTVEAYAVRVEGVDPEDAPFQAADVRRLRGEAREESADDLVERVRRLCLENRSGPVVLYVTAPLTLASPGASSEGASWPRQLVEALGNSVNDVVLAVDLSQIDTDRNRGIYGNAALAGLLEATRDLKPKRKVFLLTSAAPGQKSWPADGLGSSAFAYYLRKGLAGDGKSSEGGRPSTITVEELHRYVRRHVQEWVRKNRQGAVQTPMLVAKLPDSSAPASLSLRVIPETAASTPTIAVASHDPPPEAPAKGEAKAAPESESKEKPAPESESKVAEKAEEPKADAPGPAEPLDLLIAEWKRHDELKEKRAYEYLPGAWRSYQADLLRAERRLRAAWLDEKSPDRLARARQDIEELARRSEDIATRREARRREADDSAFRSVLGDETNAGKRELDEALKYLTGRGTDDPELIPPPPPPAPAPPPAAANPNGAANGAVQPQPAPKAPPNVAPPGLLNRPTPETYLELQLPAWACRFIAEFEKQDFFNKDARRAQVLRDIVYARADAERAIDRDRRGLPWIEPAVVRGDEVRRKLQDELFSGTMADGAQEDWDRRVVELRSIYRRARQRSESFRSARATWEQAAAELPALAEWTIRRASHRQGKGPLPASPMPREAEEALNDFEGLARLLADRPAADPLDQGDRADRWFEELDTKADAARQGLTALRGRLQEELDRLDRGATDWVAMDAVLRTPLVDAARRERILRRIKGLNEGDVPLAPGDPASEDAAGAEPSDPGFWLRAAGLARLDLRLAAIARASQDGGEGPGFPEWNASWKTARDGAAAQPASGDGAAAWPDFTAAVARTGIDPRELDPANRYPDPARRDEIEALMPGLDRTARLLDAWRLRPSDAPAVDAAAERYWRFGRFAALDLHFRRLAQDYAGPTTLRDLALVVRKVAQLVHVQPGPHLARVNSPSFKMRIRPEGTIELVNLTNQVRLEFLPPEQDARLIPAGRAFVGLAVPKGLEVVDLPREAIIPGRPVDVGGDNLSAAPVELGPYRLLQRDFQARSPFPVRAIAFYRGRVDDDSVARAAVQPSEPKDMVLVSITQDRRQLERDYPRQLVDRIRDQFKDHPGQGIVHLGGSLSYVLTFRSQFPGALDVNCEVEESDPADQGPNKSRKVTEPLHFGAKDTPQAVQTISKSIRLDADVPEQIKELKVTLTASAKNGGPALPNQVIQSEPFRVTFSQIRLSQHTDINPTFIDNCQSHPGHRRCYIVTYTRVPDDRFTEPIHTSQWKCTINGQKITLAPGWIMPGEGWGFHFAYLPPDDVANFKWTGEIEKEGIEGEDLKAWTYQKKAPAK